jgi:hypothetical protein
MHRKRVLEEKPLDMRRFDPMNVVNVARDVLVSLRDPRRRLILENFIEHARAEAFGDFEALMASCSREMQSYAGDDGAAADWQATSFEELRSCYRSLIEANIYLIHMDVEKLLVSDDEVVVAGVAHQLYRGDSLSRFGIKAADPEGVYQLTKRVLIIVAFDERGKAGGEKAYLNGPVTASDFSQVPQELIPEQFWHNPLTGEIPRQSERAVLTQ